MVNFLLRYPFCLPTLTAAFFGLLFPVNTVLFMLWHENKPLSWDNIFYLHEQHYDLLIIWTAPLVLGFFGSFIGKTSLLLKDKMTSLEQRTLQLNTILETAASAIITIDKSGAILSFNRAAEHIFGYRLAEIIGTHISRLMPMDIAIHHDEYLLHHLDTPQENFIGNRNEVNAQRKNGEIFPVLLRINPMNIDGDLFFSGVIDDISETKSLQAQLIQAQKLEAIGQLASGVAHEINTPMQYIGDNLSALSCNFNDIIAFQNHLYELADDSFKLKLNALINDHDIPFIMADSPKALKEALEGVARVSEIIEAMNTFSRGETSRIKQTVNLHETLISALTLSRNSYKYIAKIKTEFDTHIGLIDCYPGELNQVLLNLIINAVHAIEAKPSGTGLIRIGTRKLNRNGVEISIADNGIGIPDDIQEKVFNLFFTTKPVGKGTGQGLSLAHNIVVEKHQGKLFFESVLNEGTTFYIHLPIQVEEQA
jgi:two-component system NtrC family sensor kinase